MSSADKSNSVVVEPRAFLVMAVYAAQHSVDAVHGLLIGRREGNSVIVTDAAPVCSEPPTTPLVECALEIAKSAFIESDLGVVGWFTAPETLSKGTPGPVALRIAASLETDDSIEPVLIVLENEGIGRIACGEAKSVDSVVQAFGKDFGKQWMEPLEVMIQQGDKSATATQQAYRKGISISDLTDHWKTTDKSEWPKVLTGEADQYLK